MSLKGTTLLLITMIIQIILNVIILFALPAAGTFILIDTALIIATYIGFKNGKRGWAVFALIYGIISMLISFSQGNFINISILVLIAGILALTDETTK